MSLSHQVIWCVGRAYSKTNFHFIKLPQTQRHMEPRRDRGPGEVACFALILSLLTALKSDV